jgi:hypothetical protein
LSFRNNFFDMNVDEDDQRMDQDEDEMENDRGDNQALNQGDNQANNQADNQANNQADNQANNQGNNQANNQADNQANNQGNNQANNQGNNQANNQGNNQAGQAVLNNDVFTQANLQALGGGQRGQGGQGGKPPITEGHNYRLITGQRKNSKLVVCDNYSYLLEKTEVYENGTKVVHYLKCKHPSCNARAAIKNQVLGMKEGRHVHSCQRVEGQSSESIRVQELQTTMKRRAAREGSTYHVS